MTLLNTRALVDQLQTLESVALIARVSSTNLIARRIVSECIANQLALPQAIVIAGEQFAGIGRNARRWSSPAGKGIYATTLLTVAARELPLFPLQMANIVASFLRDTFAIDARIKWPNDVVVDRRKIAGTLIEARMVEELAYVVIGTGINVEPADDAGRPNAISIREATTTPFENVDDVTARFILHVDRRLGEPFRPDAILAEWNRLSVHQDGERIECVLGEETISGSWGGIDEHGRALLRRDGETTAISAGDLILA